MFLFRWFPLLATLSIFPTSALSSDVAPVVLGGEVGNAAATCAARLRCAPFDSLPWLRADLTNEKVSEHDNNFHSVMRRPYKDYSGDISGRFLEVMALDSKGNPQVHPAFKGLLEEAIRHQRPGGYFCASGIIDWQQPLDYVKGDESLATGRMLPALWGNARMLCGLIESARAFPENKSIRQAAVRLGDFYVSVLPRFNDPARINEYTNAGTYASGHVTCWFPAMEGLVKLKGLTGERKYLDAAITMADFYQRFDRLPVDHAHGMLCNQVSLLLLYHETAEREYLDRVEQRWKALVEGGYVNPAGGILEKCHVQFERDEGCAIADWLRLNLALGKATGNPRYWAMAERTLHNHFLQNQHPNGGFGHRYVFTDQQGVQGFDKRNYESTWCCTFHGELGFIQLRSNLLERADNILTCNFPLEFTASDKAGTITSLFQIPERDAQVIRQRISIAGQSATRIRVRHPHWATEVTARSSAGKALELESKDGWHTTKEPVTEVLFIYTGAPYVEDRFCNRLPAGPKDGQSFVMGYGPKLLATQVNSAKPPAWPSTLDALEARGVKPLSWAARNQPCRFVMKPAAEIKPLVHPLFADHAVLQREAKVPVWGWTEPGGTVRISFAGQKKVAVAGSEGKWTAILDPMPASVEGRSLEIHAESSNQKALIHDVLVGDVWLCSGQSNMEMGIGLCHEPAEIAKADFPRIRLLTVPHRISCEPESTLECLWRPCGPANLMKGAWGGFSAVAYFFGRELHRELGIPIGLVHSSWGGTPCEAWTSGDALKPLGDYQAQLAQVNQVASSTAPDKLPAFMDQWYREKDPGTAKEWFKPETDVSTWKRISMPATWGNSGLPGYEGIVWLQRTFDVPPAWVGKDLVLGLGTVADVDTTWVNGNLVGRSDYFDQNRSYTMPAKVVRAGRNVITLRVMNAGGGGFMASADQLKIHPAGAEGSAVSLAGPWRLQESVTRAATGTPLAGNPTTPSVLYNGMIAPLIPYAIQGAIWYQGEANTTHPARYRTLLPAMIRDWRARFGSGDFPFHIVSLANYQPPATGAPAGDWPGLREAQAMTAKQMPRCGLAVAIDIGDPKDIHPKNKREVGRRLALSALANTYRRNIEWSGPWYRSMESAAAGIRLKFDHASGGLVAKGGGLTGFTIAGEDRSFVQAEARIEGETVLVSSPTVAKPVAVRYGWAANPNCNLYNNDNLPAVPFRTDDWPSLPPHGL